MASSYAVAYTVSSGCLRKSQKIVKCAILCVGGGRTSMTPSDALKTTMERAGLSATSVARALGVSRPAVVQAMGKTHPYADSLARYLEATGYILWAVPESLHLDAITDDAIRIDAAAGPSK